MDDYKKSIKYNAKAKIQRMISPKQEKVDSSDWKAPEPLNADVKTGMRPISRRAYKRGGKVEAKAEGKAAVKRADRKAGGKVDRNRPMSVDDFLNRDQKMANEVREGGDKHVGGYKKGGRAKKNIGGGMPYGGASSIGIPQGSGMSKLRQVATGGFKKGGKVDKHDDAAMDKKLIKEMVKKEAMKKANAKSKKAFGGPTLPAQAMANANPNAAFLRKDAPGNRPMKRGGMAAEHKSMKDDIAKLKKKVGFGSSAMTPEADMGMTTAKKGGRIKKQVGGGISDADRLAMMAASASYAPQTASQAGASYQGRGGYGKNVTPIYKTPAPESVNRAAKGDRYMPPSEEDMINSINRSGRMEAIEAEMLRRSMGRAHGGRTARKEGGRVKKAKGKTNINITINAGPKSPPGAMGLGEALAGGLPAGAPVPKMPPMAPPMPPMAPPMASGPAPMGGAPMPPMGAGGPPMPLPRKAGGRVHMTAGAGSGEGRLQKIEQYGEKPPRNARKTGGRANMTAGAGSGEGRLQKIDWYGKKA